MPPNGSYACPVCGHIMLLPPGLDRPPGPCPKCGGGAGIPANESELRLEGFDDILRPKPKAAAQTKPPAKVDRVERLKQIAREAGICGGIAAGVCAAVAIPIGFVLARVIAEDPSMLSFMQIIKVAGGFGATLGFMLGSVWGACHRADVGHLGAIGLGIALGVPLCLLNMVLFVPRSIMPEVTTLEFLIAGAIAGAVSGAVLGIRGDD
jgi:hypothetical protein